jgi:hypothetical protein
MGTAAEHLDAWERAGLIDQATADRLRAADLEVVPPAPQAGPAGPATSRLTPRASSQFGPPVAIAEVFGYLGTAFLLAAWYTWVASRASAATDASWVIGIGAGVAAIGFVFLGAILHRGDDRQQRAAGVSFLVVLASVGIAATSLAGSAHVDWPDVAVIASAVTLAVGVACRGYHPSVLTQIGLLSALTSFVGSALIWFEGAIFPSRVVFDPNGPGSTGADPIVLVLGSAAWWLAVAVAIGLLGLAESTSAERSGDAAAGRRAGVSRFWAGMVAIVGLATAVSRTDYLAGGGYGRVLEPWAGDLGLLIVTAVLIERAFRRESSSYVYAAALGLIIALSDLNFSYLTGGIESALLIEGLILLGAGIAADRLRRRIGGRQRPPAAPAGMDDGLASPVLRADDSPAGDSSIATTEP